MKNQSLETDLNDMNPFASPQAPLVEENDFNPKTFAKRHPYVAGGLALAMATALCLAHYFIDNKIDRDDAKTQSQSYTSAPFIPNSE